MKFELSTSGNFYSKSEHVNRLIDLGFEFKPYEDRFMIVDDYENHPTIEINFLDELMSFIDAYGEIIINRNSIEIYDNYRE
ncbi:MAG: hypothetical protein ACYDEI_00305 [Erysipelotrichaceae bacterium]